MLLDDRAALAAALEKLAVPAVGVDVERADGLRYFRRAALIQVGDASRCLLVDPLAIDDLDPLAAFLDGRLAVLHAVENDLAPLASVGVRLASVADTAIAAGLLGLPTGLGPLLAEVLGVELAADKERFQRADWEQRPLGADMRAYAAEDVVHLPRLWDALEERLAATGRTSWYEQELADRVERAREDRRDWSRTRGADRLDPRGWAILRALWEEREAIARVDDVAPQRIIRDELIIRLAIEPPSSIGDMVRRGLRRGPAKRYGARLFEAARRGAAAPEETGRALRRPTDADRAAYERLRRRRSQVATEVGVDPGILCPGQALWHVVLADPADPGELVAGAGLRPWQAELLAAPLWDAYRPTRAP